MKVFTNKTINTVVDAVTIEWSVMNDFILEGNTKMANHCIKALEYKIEGIRSFLLSQDLDNYKKNKDDIYALEQTLTGLWRTVNGYTDFNQD